MRTVIVEPRKLDTLVAQAVVSPKHLDVDTQLPAYLRPLAQCLMAGITLRGAAEALRVSPASITRLKDDLEVWVKALGYGPEQCSRRGEIRERPANAMPTRREVVSSGMGTLPLPTNMSYSEDDGWIISWEGYRYVKRARADWGCAEDMLR